VSARRLLLVALALLAGCDSTSTRPSIRLSGPAAVAIYRGLSTRDAANLRTYFAVANERGDDLRLLDAIDGQAVLAPALVQALSVPTAPRPSMLAAGGLHDAEPAGKTDLLAVASTGLVACDPTTPTRLSGCVEVVATWVAATAMSSSLRVTVDDLPGGQDAAVLSLAVAPVPEPDPAGGWRAAAGRARVVAGLSGGRLLVAEYVRGADGVRIDLAGAAVHALGFDPGSLAVSPDPRHVYAASLDAIDQVNGLHGVAELDLTGAYDAPPAVRLIQASRPTSLPTTVVLAARVRTFQDLTSDPKRDLLGPEVLRVYAALDPQRCGREKEVACGVAVLDPLAGGPVADPAGELPMHAPIPVTGQVLAMAAVYPPALGGLKEDGSPATSAAEAVYQKQATAVSDRWVSTLAAVASSSGAVVLLDLARGAPALDRDVLATVTQGTQAHVQGVTSSAAPSAEHPAIGLWDERTAEPVVTADGAVMVLLPEMAPGYTGSELWRATWEGELPGLAGVKAELQSTGTSPGSTLAWLALQVSADATIPGVAPLREVGRLQDPRSWLKPGDIAVVIPPVDDPRCPNGPFELEVTGFLEPDPDNYPGGAVTVTPRAVQPVTSDGLTGDPACRDAAGRSVALVTFRAGGLVVTGSSFGYAGRARFDEPFALRHQETSALSCAPLDSPGWPRAGDTCDQACRDACETVYLARSSRRAFYVAEQCLDPAVDPDCSARWGTAPLVNPVGPVLAFKPGKVYASDATDLTAEPARDSYLQVTTASGLVPASRRPLSGTNAIGALLPSGLATYDRSAETGLEASGVRVFASYPTNQVLDFSPALGASLVTVHR
jgi:hypothetical protein